MATNASLEWYENSVFKASPNNERNRSCASEGLEWARPCHEGEPLINIILIGNLLEDYVRIPRFSHGNHRPCTKPGPVSGYPPSVTTFGTVGTRRSGAAPRHGVAYPTLWAKYHSPGLYPKPPLIQFTHVLNCREPGACSRRGPQLYIILSTLQEAPFYFPPYPLPPTRGTSCHSRLKISLPLPEKTSWSWESNRTSSLSPSPRYRGLNNHQTTPLRSNSLKPRTLLRSLTRCAHPKIFTPRTKPTAVRSFHEAQRIQP